MFDGGLKKTRKREESKRESRTKRGEHEEKRGYTLCVYGIYMRAHANV